MRLKIEKYEEERKRIQKEKAKKSKKIAES
jgi:hypothetical protein